MDRPAPMPGELDQMLPAEQAAVDPNLELENIEGVLDIHNDGFGFLRTLTWQLELRPSDPYVSAEMVRRYGLRSGVRIEGKIPVGQQPSGNQAAWSTGRQPYGRQPRQQGPRLYSIDTIDGLTPDEYRNVKAFDSNTPIDPRVWLRTETVSDRLTTRVLDMFTPIGMGTRGLIVAPPRSGKTVLLQHMAEGIATNFPKVELMVLLVDERPEEVTEMRRSIKGNVYASSNDKDAQNHTRLAEIVIERAKRLAEQGKDVVVLLDSITRLARAYNKLMSSGGRTMSGGLDTRALDTPKRLFGGARAFDEGGSLTIMATALIETNSRMDDVIFQEFKGTGNMELVLDRRLADRRIYPAIDIPASGTRKEERILPEEMLEKIILLRRSLLKMNDVEIMTQLTAQLKKYPTNAEFLDSLARFLK